MAKSILLTAMAGAMGWGIRGQYGHETGAMIAGVLVSLVLVLLHCPQAASLPAARAVAFGTIAMGIGGSMTYGQTIGLTQNPEVIGNWEAWRWGMLGLGIKGAIWIGFAGLFLGMALGGQRYSGRDVFRLMLGMFVLYAAGWWMLNQPFDPAIGLTAAACGPLIAAGSARCTTLDVGPPRRTRGNRDDSGYDAHSGRVLARERLNEAVGSERERPVSSSLRQGLGWIGIAMFVVAVCALVGAAQRGKPTARQIRQRLLLELQPVTLKNCTLERIGSANDGGYLMCANLLGDVQSAYSVRHRPGRRLGLRDFAPLRRAGASI